MQTHLDFNHACENQADKKSDLKRGLTASQAQAPGTGQTLHLHQGEVTLYQRFISSEKALALFQHLEAAVPWQQDDITIAGRTVRIPRLQAWFGDANMAYTYSGLTLNPVPFLSALDALRNTLSAMTDAHFNSLLANYYRDGNDSVGWHSDDEPELGDNPIIASLSLGATRRFVLKHKRKPALDKCNLQLASGDLLIMSGETQHHWRHQVPKTRLPVGPRINLTFRQIKK